MPIYNEQEYSNNYSEALWLSYGYYIWLCYRDELALENNDVIVDFTGNTTTDSFKFKEKITGKTRSNDTRNVETIVPLKYLSNFREPLKRH